MHPKTLIVVGLLLGIALLASATTPSDWAIVVSSNTYYVPACSAQVNIKHFEIPTSTPDIETHVQTYDAFKTRAWSNIQFRILSSGLGVWSADCALAS